MEPISDFKTLQDSIQQSLVAVTRSANSIASEDLAFHRSLDPTVATALDTQNARLLSLAQRLLANAAANTEVVRPKLSDLDAVEGNWRGIVDVVDSLLEKADISLDEYTGAVKRLSPSREQTPTKTPRSPSRIATALRSQAIAKPQLLFQHVPTNAEKEPFTPLLEMKPHAIISLPASLKLQEAQDKTLQYPHPYKTEIEQYEYPSSVYTKADPTMYSPFESTTATLVDTEEGMEQMLKELKSAKEIAIDLEHHDQRSYIGIVSLMQISTRNKDWIVDTLKPWRRKLQCLNEVFADPHILKVFHGAHMDMIWLQRDLGLYVVGLFDTHYASRALGYPGGSLAFLLKKFINFDAQKQYQTADWRIRPLPTELFDYARSDTHFLLYIYDNMRNELIDKSDFAIPNHEKDKVHDVLMRSKEVGLQTYQHPVYDFDRGLGQSGWFKMVNRTPAKFTKQEFAVFRAVHQWRDTVAREQDDSVHYILANHNVFSIAKEMPTEKAALFSVSQPLTQTIRLRADELLSVIRKAKETGDQGPEPWELIQEVKTYVYGDSEVKPPPYATPAPAAIQPTETPKGTVLNHTINGTTSTLRTSLSHFWGSAFNSSTWTQRRPHHTLSDMTLAVPLPPLTASIFAENPSLTPARAPPTPHTRPPSENPSPATDAEIFTLRQQSRKRKSPPREDNDLAANADEVDISDLGLHSAAKAEKAAKRAARKSEKRARKEAEEGADIDASTLAHSSRKSKRKDADADAEPEMDFDYETAPSVLHGSRGDEGKRGKRRDRDRDIGGKKKRKEVNPFVKALDAPKGLARGQKERAGKSMTFRN